MGSILNPVRELTVNGKTVQVRELRAVDGLQFIKHLGEFFSDFQKESEDRGGSRNAIGAMVLGSTELSQFLVLKATGNPNEWMTEISTEEFLDVLTAAVELNITEGLIKKALGVVDVFRGRIQSTTQKPS